MGKRAPCGCEKVGGGWNFSECTCPSLHRLMGPHYRWASPRITLETFAGSVGGRQPACGCVRTPAGWEAQACTCPARPRIEATFSVMANDLRFGKPGVRREEEETKAEAPAEAEVVDAA